jgi:thiol-disulfide isomerase/thioredoxin
MKKQQSFIIMVLIPAMSLFAGNRINNLTTNTIVGRLPSIQIAQTKDSIDIVALDLKLFEELIISSDKDYHLVVFFAEWCKPCREKLPIIEHIAGEFHNLACYYIYPDTYKNIKFLRKYLNNQPSISKIYILSNIYKGNVKKRFISFRDQICKECELNLGFPTVILLDKHMTVLYKSTGSIEELMDELTKNLNE